MINTHLLNSSVFTLFYYFVIYSFVGWCIEIVYTLIKKREFINRGFLQGPLCPIYGFGTLSIIVLLKPIENNYIFLFLGSIFLTSLLEYVTGYILETVFNSTWWDYGDKPYNLHGRICLYFSIIWGIVSVFILKVVHPYIIYIVNLIPPNKDRMIFYITLVYLIMDLTITVITIFKLRSILTQINTAYLDLTEKLSDLKLNLGNTKDMSEFKIRLYWLIESAEIKMSKKKSDIENILKELKTKYDYLFIRKCPDYSRLIKAFPNLRFKGLESIFKDVKNKVYKNKLS